MRQKQSLNNQQIKLKHWPAPQDYQEAIQTPSVSLTNPDLGGAQVHVNEHGLPVVASGMFASVYRLSSDRGDWAVRCFLRHNQDREERYHLIEKALFDAKLPFTIAFNFQEQGILVNGTWFPILQMDWCKGVSLTEWVARNLQDRRRLAKLADSFQAMVRELRSAGIAHGDLQHGNILVDDDELRLVDYDGLYTDDLARLGTSELGHANYQHPTRSHHHFGMYLDHFSQWVIHCSLRCLAIDPSLWESLGGGDECLLFRKADFQKPADSSAFRALEAHHDRTVRQCSRTIRYLLTLPIAEIPSIGEHIQVPKKFPDLPPAPEKISLSTKEPRSSPEVRSRHQSRDRSVARIFAQVVFWASICAIAGPMAFQHLASNIHIAVSTKESAHPDSSSASKPPPEPPRDELTPDANKLAKEAWSEERSGNFAKAAELYERAETTYRKTNGENHSTAVLTGDFARAYAESGQKEKARLSYLLAIKTFEKYPMRDDTEFASVLESYAGFIDSTDQAQARKIYRRAARVRTSQ
jgi:serine/threonine protein kinase